MPRSQKTFFAGPDRRSPDGRYHRGSHNYRHEDDQDDRKQDLYNRYDPERIFTVIKNHKRHPRRDKDLCLDENYLR